MNKILITGSAGFIGFHLTLKFLKEKFEVVGIDNINDYYDVNLKYARLAETGIYAKDETEFSGGKNRTYSRIEFNTPIQSMTYEKYKFVRLNLEDKQPLMHLFETEKFDYVINLAAQAGVRYSIENPDVYVQSNIVGFLNILEACRQYPVKHLVYASSSSVYGNNKKIPFAVSHPVDNPVSLYAATKKSNELMAHTYSHLYNIPTTGLRFFTVYGPWGRPDMAIMLFTKAILKNRPIKVFNKGMLERDFTYIDDIINGTYNVLLQAPQENNKPSIFNIGNGKPVKLLDFIQTLEKQLETPAIKEMVAMQPGDVEKTWADTSELEKMIHYKPETNIESGIEEFITWYKKFYL